MSDHTTAWLNAYFDGELDGRKLSSAEEHLSHCATCLKELDELGGLSSLLQSSPGPENLLSSDQFVNQVGLRMPRSPDQPRSQRVLSMGWQITPLGIFGLWSFIQAVFIVAGILILAANLGFGGDTFASLVSSSQAGSSISDLFSLQGASPNEFTQTTLGFLVSGGPFGWGVIINLGLSFILGLLYCSWLASWWVRNRSSNTSTASLMFNSNGH